MRFMMLTAAALAATIAIADSANSQTILRAGSVLPASSDQGQAAELFAQRVHELTDGEVTIQVFHGGELGTPPIQYENVIVGAQDFVIDTIDYLKSYDDRIGIINTPFVFRDREHYQKYLQSDAFAEIAATIEERGMIFIGDYNWIRQQDRGILSRDPIRTPEDIQGYKIRMFQAEIPIQAWSLMGANVQVIAWGDVYPALVTGAVDGLTTQVSSSYLSKQTEVLDNFTVLREYFQAIVPIMSKRSWERLSPEHQEAILHAAEDAGSVFNEISKEQNDRDVAAAIEEHGLNIIEVDLEPWREKAKEVHRELEEQGYLPIGIIKSAQEIE